MLTSDQDKALKEIILFMNDDKKYVHVLIGSAGTGKTYLTKRIIEIYSKIKICCIAPTHVAKDILIKMTHPLSVDVCTIAKILGKFKEHSYIGTKSFSMGSYNNLDKYKMFIIDEISMVSDNDLRIIMEYVQKNKKKLLCIGDRFQIPSPCQPISKVLFNNKAICYKSDSMAFKSLNDTSELTQIVRQQSESYIIKLATKIRDNIMNDTKIDHDAEILSLNDMLDSFVDDVGKYDKCRCICYTNKSVHDMNLLIRNRLFKNKNTSKDTSTSTSTSTSTGVEDIVKEMNIDDYVEIKKFYEGETLMAYNTLGYPITYIENGRDYKIKYVSYTKDFVIRGFYGLQGHLIKLENIEKILFFIEINNMYNKDFIRELIRLAKIVNSKQSTKNDYISYNTLRNEVVFLEDIYIYNDHNNDNKNEQYYSKYDLKNIHPLLFTKTKDIITHDKKVINNSLSERIKHDYNHILQDRLSDDKVLSDGETLSDKFMVIEKDMDYAYAITAHKSQGSTYNVVYVLDSDFDALTNSFNYTFNCIEYKTKERNQLKYVSYTRAKDHLKFFTL